MSRQHLTQEEAARKREFFDRVDEVMQMLDEAPTVTHSKNLRSRETARLTIAIGVAKFALKAMNYLQSAITNIGSCDPETRFNQRRRMWESRLKQRKKDIRIRNKP